MSKKLTRNLGEPAPIPESAIKRAEQILRGGQLTRYGEFADTESEVAALEREFALYLGARFAVALNSGGNAIYLALLGAGVKPGDEVLMNAFTLAPVPGAVANAGATPVYVECGDDYMIDIEDFKRKASGSAKVLLLSHMRGHIADMKAITDICDQHNITLVEDCAHTLGAYWDETASGRFGQFGCYSLQAYKHINAGEGGVLVTDDENAAARAILYSGSYMLYEQHDARPAKEVFERHRLATPNFSLRMPEVTAALARPQLELLPERVGNWNRGYGFVAAALQGLNHVVMPVRDPREAFVGSSLQFSLIGVNYSQIEQIVAVCQDSGLGLKWFGRQTPEGFTSQWRHWRYKDDIPDLQKTAVMLAGLCDMRIPLDLTRNDAEDIRTILSSAIGTTT